VANDTRAAATDAILAALQSGAATTVTTPNFVRALLGGLLFLSLAGLTLHSLWFR
jgi:hypothetical protein